MFAVQEVQVTENFEMMNKNPKNCQLIETYEACMNNHLILMIKENCSCLPYELSDFTVN